MLHIGHAFAAWLAAMSLGLVFWFAFLAVDLAIERRVKNMTNVRESRPQPQSQDYTLRKQ